MENALFLFAEVCRINIIVEAAKIQNEQDKSLQRELTYDSGWFFNQAENIESAINTYR